MSNTEVMLAALQLCEWIAETPHHRGSINGRAAQVAHSLRAALSHPVQVEQRAALPTKEMIDVAEKLDWSDSDVRANIVNMWQSMVAVQPVQGEHAGFPEQGDQTWPTPPKPAPQAEQEAVYYEVAAEITGWHWCRCPDKKQYKEYTDNGWKGRMLYTTPQPQQWVGLIQGEIDIIAGRVWGCSSIAPRHAAQFALQIESKLREKNTHPAAAGAPANFPKSIMELLIEVADRKGTGTKAPWEDGDGNPMQDAADAAIAWINSRAAAGEVADQPDLPPILRRQAS